MSASAVPDLVGVDLLNVLLIEDNRGDVLLLREALGGGSIEVRPAGTLAEGLAILEHERFDGVLLDLGLPDSQGLATLAAVLAATRKPVIVVTGLADEAVGLAAVRHGAQDFLVKGRVDDGTLQRSVRYAIERWRVREVLAAPLLETAPVGLAVLDQDLRFLYVNPALAAITGLTPALHLGRRAAEVLPPLDTGTAAMLQDVLVSGSALRDVELSSPGDPAGHAEQTLLLSAEPMWDVRDSIVGLSLSISDISERKRKEEALAALAESRSQAHAIGESIPFGIWISDPEGGMRYLSNSYLELVGLSMEEAAGHGWTRAVPPDEVEPMLADWLDCLAAGSAWEREYRVWGVDERWHTLLSRGYPVRSEGGAVLSWAGINLDITERKDAELFREALVGVLSHELRTPVTSIFGAAKVLTRTDLAETTRAELLADVEAESERLRRLIDDLLILAKAEQGRVEFGEEPVLIQHLVPRLVADVARRWPAARFDVTIGDLPVARGDQALVEQVLHNLLSNAAKYAGAHGPIEVEAGASEGGVWIAVRDHGPGIDAAEAGQLFDLFYRSRSTARAVAGSGIGLFVVRRLVESMHGRVWARSRADGHPGAEFGFRLLAIADGEG
jgi:PAS domain S-box-containing protein